MQRPATFVDCSAGSIFFILARVEFVWGAFVSFFFLNKNYFLFFFFRLLRGLVEEGEEYIFEFFRACGGAKIGYPPFFFCTFLW